MQFVRYRAWACPDPILHILIVLLPVLHVDQSPRTTTTTTTTEHEEEEEEGEEDNECV